MRLQSLKKKSVINIYNGNFIGYITDVVITLPEGNIESIIVKPSIIKRVGKWLFSSTKTIVRWNEIVSIGKDVILVNIIDK